MYQIYIYIIEFCGLTCDHDVHSLMCDLNLNRANHIIIIIIIRALLYLVNCNSLKKKYIYYYVIQKFDGLESFIQHTNEKSNGRLKSI